MKVVMTPVTLIPLMRKVAYSRAYFTGCSSEDVVET